MDMADTKTKRIVVLVTPDLYERLRRKSEETGVPVAEPARRALETWALTGEMMKPKKPTK
jgi:hypothetical protein